MHGLPSNFDPLVFVGRIMEQLSFSRNTICLSFEGSLSVTVEGTFEHQVTADTADVDAGEPPLGVSRLMQLVGEPVVAASVEGAGTLDLRFANGQVFRCLDDSSTYESYRISISGREIVV